MGLDRSVAQPDKCLSRDIKCHVRVPVAVSANPRPEFQEDGYLECVSGITGFQSSSQIAVDTGNHLPQSRGNSQSPLDLLQHGGAGWTKKITLPENGQFGSDTGFQLQTLARQKIRPIKFLQRLAHAAKFDTKSPSLGFTRMSRKDQFNRQSIDGRLCLDGREPRLLHLGDGFANRFAARLRITFQLTQSQNPHSVPILSEIRQIEIDTKGAGDNTCRRLVQCRNQRRELAFCIDQTRASLPRNLSDRFDAIECFRSRQLPNDSSQHVTQLTNVPTQQFVTDCSQFGSAQEKCKPTSTSNKRAMARAAGIDRK